MESVVGNGRGVAPSEAAEIPDLRIYLERLLGSTTFSVTPRRSRLLRYLVDRTLAGEADRITEYGIGLDVFERPPSFDPRIESTVRAEMSRLRRTLCDYYKQDGTSDPWRISFPNRGYIPAMVKVADVSAAQPSGTASGEDRFAPVEPVAPHRVPAFRRWIWIGMGAVLLSISAFAMWRTYFGRKPFLSVVVLPLANLTGDSTKEYLADGITEQLTDSLAQIPSLRVVARTSAFQFKGKGVDVREIGKRLDVEAVVEGSLQQVDGRYRLTVQVNRASDGYHILSRSSDGKMTDLARMEREAAAPVVAVLRPGTISATSHLPDAEAYDLYLKSSYVPGITTESFDRSIELLTKAIQHDPRYADAYAALAETYASKAMNAAVRPGDFVAPVRAAAEKALQLNPLSAPAYTAEGFVDAVIARDFERGAAELHKAIQLAPGRAKSHNWLGVVLMGFGRFPEALAELRISEALDPLSPAATVARALYMARQYDESVEACARMLRLHPDQPAIHLMMGLAWEGKGEYQRALEEYRRFDAKVPGAPLFKASLAHLYARSGESGKARRLLAELEHPKPGEQQPNALDMAMAYGWLHDKDKAFEWLNRALDAGDSWSFKVEPLLDPLRNDPRFNDLLKTAGFTPGSGQ